MGAASYLDLFSAFLKMGFMLFGGLYSGPAVYYKVLVEERGWLSGEQLTSLFGAAHTVPGPVLVSTAVQIGYALRGLPGSVVAVLGLLTPNFTLALGLAVLLRSYMDHWVTRAALRGVNAAVLALLLYAMLRLSGSILLRSGALDYVSLALFALISVLLIAMKVEAAILVVLAALASVLVRAVLGL